MNLVLHKERGLAEQIGRPMQSELPADVGAMGFDCFDAQVQIGSDLATILAFTEQAKNF